MGFRKAGKGSAGLPDVGLIDRPPGTGVTQWPSRWAQEAEKRCLDSTHQTKPVPLRFRNCVQAQAWSGHCRPSSPWGSVLSKERTGHQAPHLQEGSPGVRGARKAECLLHTFVQ